MKQKKTLKDQIIRHVVIFLGFILLGFLYAHPVLSGEEMVQGDIVQFRGMSHEIQVYRDVADEEPYWTNSMFSGMPSFNISTQYGYQFTRFLHKNVIGLLPSPVNYFFVLMLGMFILLRSGGANIWLSGIGAAAFAFSSNYMISLEAGHNTKVLTMGYSAALLGAVIFAYRGKWLSGLLLTILFTGLIFVSNHVQIIYYLLLVLIFVAIFYFIEFLREKRLATFFKRSALLILAAAIGILPNVSKLWSIYEHGKNTMRGGASELTYKENKSGLEKDYAFRWSLRPDETFTTLVPYYLGGGNSESLGENSNTYKTAQQFFGNNAAEQIASHVPLYFGDQPFTSGPNYFGSIIIFLFMLGLLVVKKPLKYWLIPAVILSIFLSWGRHFPSFNYFLFDTLPLFNKFRTPSMAIHVAGMLFPMLGILGLHHILNQKSDKAELLKKLKQAVGISLGILALLFIYGIMFRDYSSPNDLQTLARSFGLNPNNPQQANVLQGLVNAIEDDRARMFNLDILRSAIFILLSAGILWAYLKGKVKKSIYALVGIGLLLIVDVWTVSKRYFNAEDFKKPSQVEQRVSPKQYDMQILQAEFNRRPETQELFNEMQNEARQREGSLSQEEVNQLKFDALMMTSHYRVLNLATNTFNDAITSYFHKSVGGYHAAKQQRYQDVIDFHLSGQHLHRPVINMLNAKYVITGRQGQAQAQPNPGALGNAWFVEDYVVVPTANDEIRMLHKAYEVTDLTGENGTHVHRSTFSKDTLGSFENLILSTARDWQESGYRMSLERLNLQLGDTMIVGSGVNADRKVNEANVAPRHAMIRLVYTFEPSQDVIVEDEFLDYLEGLNDFAPAPSDRITLTEYSPRRMEYQSSGTGERLAVFSEIFYEDGWKAYIDGEQAEHIRVNYLLRAMRIPEGEHEIIFWFMPRTIEAGRKINLAGSVLFALFLLGGLFWLYRDRKKEEEKMQEETKES